jgi:hypothetical protein
MAPNILILALIGIAMLAYAIPTSVFAYRQMRYPKPFVIGIFYLGDILLTSAVAAAIIKYLL